MLNLEDLNKLIKESIEVSGISSSYNWKPKEGDWVVITKTSESEDFTKEMEVFNNLCIKIISVFKYLKHDYTSVIFQDNTIVDSKIPNYLGNYSWRYSYKHFRKAELNEIPKDDKPYFIK